jgi:DNA-binding LacI/PurR family transcriptional regulator
MSKVTIRDVAKQAGVGVGTVSRVLNGNHAVSTTTKQKVLDAIEALNYTPNLIARRLSLGKTMTIAVIAPFFIRSSYVERLRGVDSVLANSEYDFIIYNVETVTRRNTYFRTIVNSERMDGLLIMSLTPKDDEMVRFKRSGVPTVLIDSTHSAISRVVIDDVAGGYRATQHLIDLGHRKIAYLSDVMHENPFNFRPVEARYQGYKKALADAGIPLRSDYVCEGELNRREARRITHQLMSLADPPTAIFAYSDTQAYGVLQAAQEMELNVPHQLSVIGYDDIEMSEYVHLTTIRQQLYESGVRGAELLLSEIAQASPEPNEIVLPTELVVRRTTAPLG